MAKVTPAQPTQRDDDEDVSMHRYRSTKCITIGSLLSEADEADDSDAEDESDPHREATEVAKIYDIMNVHFQGGNALQESALTKVIKDIPYKGRKYEGKLLHVACLSQHQSSHELVERLVDMKASPHEPAHGAWPGVAKNGLEVQPIHLAAAVGNLFTIRSLLHLGADIDAVSKHDGKEHYTALHNAVWFSFDEIVVYLTRKNANLDIQNLKGETPLHIAVKSNDLPLVKHLVKAGADKEKRAIGGETATDLAIQCSPEAIDAVASRSLKTLLLAAKLGAQEAAYRTIVDRNNKIKTAWRKALIVESEFSPDTFRENLLKLSRYSPLAVATILDGLAEEPTAAYSQYLPPRSSTVHKKFFPTELREDIVWPDPRGSKETWMTRLTKLAPDDLLNNAHDSQDEDEQLVKVKIVRVRGIVSLGILEMIANADENDACLCESIVSLAVMNMCWLNFAGPTAFADIIYRLLAVVLMTCSVFFKIMIPTEFGLLLNQACWHGVAAIVSLEVLCSLILLFRVAKSMMKKTSILDTVRQNMTNFFELTFNGALVYMICVGAQEGFDLCAVPWLAALTLLVRWLLLAWSFRTVDGIGQILLPIILASFEPVKGVQGVLWVALIGFFAFFTAFLALGSEDPDVSILGVLTYTMRLLLLGDGDGIDAVLRAFAVDQEADPRLVGVVFLAAAVFVFVIVILNLLIAAYGEASLENGEVKFRQQVAKVCINAWRRPSWPFGCPALRLPDQIKVSVYLAVMLLGLIVWILLFSFAREHAAICLVPAMALFMGDCILNQKPWLDDGDGPRHHYLWMCHQQMLEQGESQDGVDYRDLFRKLSRRLDMKHRKLHRKMEQLMIRAGVAAGVKLNQLDYVQSALQTPRSQEAPDSLAQYNQNDQRQKHNSDVSAIRQPNMALSAIRHASTTPLAPPGSSWPLGLTPQSWSCPAPLDMDGLGQSKQNEGRQKDDSGAPGFSDSPSKQDVASSQVLE